MNPAYVQEEAVLPAKQTYGVQGAFCANVSKNGRERDRYPFDVSKAETSQLLNLLKSCSFYVCFMQNMRTKSDKFVIPGGKIVVEKD